MPLNGSASDVTYVSTLVLEAQGSINQVMDVSRHLLNIIHSFIHFLFRLFLEQAGSMLFLKQEKKKPQPDTPAN